MDYCFHCAEDITQHTLNGSFCPNCGKQYAVYYPQSNELPPGTYLNNNRYFVGRSIGTGGFGITYIGFDTKLQKKIVIKETFYSGLFKRNCNDKSNHEPLKVTFDSSIDIQKILNKTKKECYTLAKAESLNNILKVYDWFNENNTSYIIIEYINGNTLYDKIKANGRYTWSELYTHIRPLMQSLSQLHHENVFHRDIKPKNIMIRQLIDDDEFVLIDFGLARTNENTTLASQGIAFSPGYSPFEQRTFGKKDGTYTDVYSIAATIYCALSSEDPSTEMYDTVDENFPKLEALRNLDDVPDYVVDTLRYALQPDYRMRCQTIDELIDRLDNNTSKKAAYKAVDNISRDKINNRSYYSGETIVSHIQDANDSNSQRNTTDNIYFTQSKYYGDNFNTTRNSVFEELKVTPKKYLSKIIGAGVTLLAIAGIIIGVNMTRNVNIPSSGSKIKNNKSAVESRIKESFENTSSNISSAVINEDKANVSSESEYVTIPDVKGLSLDTAKEMIITAGFYCKTVEEENNSIENNHILSQSPAAGDKAEKGTTVNLVVSKQKKESKSETAASSKTEPITIEVPDVTNLSYEDAVNKLAQRGLIADIEYQNNDSVEANHVVSQSPSKGKVDPQSKISLIISKGTDTSVFKVENYVGQNIDSVKAALEENDVKAVYSYVDIANSTGNILSQNISPGSTIQKGSAITFTVSQKAYDYNTGIFFRNLTCSSQMDGFGKDNVLYFLGGNAWAPNNNGGIGEYLYFDVPSNGNSVTIYGFIIDIGVTRNSEEFWNNGRATGLHFEFSDNSSYDVKLSDVMTHQVFYLDHSVDTSYLKIVITDSTSGNLRNNPCISTIVPLI